MSNENYVNSYIEILTGTMQEAVLKSVSLQASLRNNELILNELNKTVQDQKNIIDNLQSMVSNKDNENVSKYNELNKINSDLSAELSVLRQQKVEFENVKSQLQHLDAFRNELIKERESHQRTKDDLENQIKLLSEKLEPKVILPQTPVAPKVEQPKVDVKQKVSKTKLVKDGGSF